MAAAGVEDVALQRGSVDCQVVWTRATDGAELRALLTAEERERYRRLHDPADRARFVTGRALARAVIGHRLDSRPDEVVFTRSCRRCGGPHGKPEVPGSPVSFSLSHAGGQVLLALTEGVDVGVDVERTGGRYAERLAAMVLSSAELSSLASVVPWRREHAFRVYWTRKEALLKTVGLGVLSSMRAITVSPADGRAELVAWEKRTDVPRFRLADLGAPDGYAAALAAHGGRGVRLLEFRTEHPLDVPPGRGTSQGRFREASPRRDGRRSPDPGRGWPAGSGACSSRVPGPARS
ncbi:4'-phosphopantetheinyl transferase family protein [Streptomyces sp. NPDC059176]|uniref:4'-phosphopantetheinyl transferase family protein n=1 Tax=unclassified Streptomyces TaxID=2593676 RepID=UPI0036C3E1B5